MQTFTLAHGGHGLTDATTLLHWLVEPAHLPLVLLAAVGGLALLRWSRRRARG